MWRVKGFGASSDLHHNHFGVKTVETDGRVGRLHEYLSVEEEKQFLAPFFAPARSGEIATATEVKLAFEARVGHEVEESTIYRLLDRHGWRKLMPRPKHPRGSKEEQERLKKTLRRRFMRQSRHG